MADRELKIRVTAEDAGVSQTINRITQAMNDVAAKGGDRNIVFEAEFKEGLVSQIVTDEANRMQREAEKHTIKIEAEMISKEANERLFGPETVKKPISFPVTIDQLKPGDIEAFLDENAKEIERSWASEFDPVSKRMGREFGHHGGEEAGGGFIESLKDSLGKHSAAGEFAELFHKALKGGGVLFAAGIGANIFAEMGEGAEQLAEKIGEGKLNAAQAEAEFIKSVPIIGKMVSGTQAFAAALDGSAVKAGELKDQLERIEAARKGTEQHAAAAEADLNPILDRQDPGLSEHMQKLAESDRQHKEDLKAIAAAEREVEGIRESIGKLGGYELDPEKRKRNEYESAELVKKYNEKSQQLAEAKEKADSDQRNRDAAADAEDAKKSDDQYRQQQDGFNDREIAAEQEHYAAQQQAASEAQQATLESQGRFLEARLKASQTAHDREIDQADDRREKEQAGLEPDDLRYKAADQRFDEAAAAADAKLKTDQDATRQKDQQQRFNDLQSFARQQADAQLQMDQQKLRDAGQMQEADRLQAQQAYADKLADNQAYFDEQRRMHAENTAILNQQQAEADATAKRQQDLTLAGIQGRYGGALDAERHLSRAEDDRFGRGYRDDAILRANRSSEKDRSPITPEWASSVTSLLQKIADKTGITFGAPLN